MVLLEILSQVNPDVTFSEILGYPPKPSVADDLPLDIFVGRHCFVEEPNLLASQCYMCTHLNLTTEFELSNGAWLSVTSITKVIGVAVLLVSIGSPWPSVIRFSLYLRSFFGKS